MNTTRSSGTDLSTPAPAQERYHLSGIAGVGMSALAQWLLDAGYLVTGSDRFHDQGRPLPVLETLRRQGVTLYPQDGSALADPPSGLVVSTAIETDNPEIKQANALQIPILHRAELLAQHANQHQTIGIAGTAGKTTTTGMVGWILEQAGWNPTVVNGGAVADWSGADRVGSVRKGGDDWWVVELDESDKSLLHFTPDRAVITNISRDHFDWEETVELFRDFAGQVKTELVCGPDLPADITHPNRLAAGPFEPEAEPAGYRFQYGDESFSIHLPGMHNAENAFNAAVLCDRIGVPRDVIREALASFRGIERRLQPVGSGRVMVIDDYAHNPVKIRAAWSAMRRHGKRILGVWKPHGYGPLASMAGELTEIFSDLCTPDDQLYILPVFYAGGTAGGALESDAFVERLIQAGVPAHYAPDYPDLQGRLKAEVREGDVVLCMGARDPELPEFARRLAECVNAAGG